MTDRDNIRTPCDDIQAVLPWYVNQTLDADEHERIAAHLEACNECTAALVHWRQIAHALTDPVPSVAPARRTLMTAPVLGPQRTSARPTRNGLEELWALARVQARLLPWGLWPAVALVLAIGVIVVLSSDWPAHTALGILAPLAAAASVTLACTEENDPRKEIALASPLTARLVLLTRLVLVLGYDILLALAASIVLLLGGHQPLDPLLGAWLAPMLGLSGAALLATVILDPGIAIALAFSLWVMRWAAPVDPGTVVLLAIGALCLTTATLRIQRYER